MSASGPYRRSDRPASPASGFTIIELLIATAIFALVLILLTTGVMQFTRQYYKGIIASKTQATARAIIDDVTRSIQFNGGDVYPLTLAGGGGGPVAGYCIGEAKRYSFAVNSQVVDTTPNPSQQQSRHALISDDVTGCSSSSPALNARVITNLSGSNPRELLGENMRLAQFSITGGGDIYTVIVKVVYGDSDLLLGAPPNVSCRPAAGSEFCTVSELSTTINKRVN